MSHVNLQVVQLWSKFFWGTWIHIARGSPPKMLVIFCGACSLPNSSRESPSLSELAMLTRAPERKRGGGGHCGGNHSPLRSVLARHKKTTHLPEVARATSQQGRPQIEHSNSGIARERVKLGARSIYADNDHDGAPQEALHAKARLHPHAEQGFRTHWVRLVW